jgi:methylthioribose-1-phosphate isomerase
VNVFGRPFRSIWVEPDARVPRIIDQTLLPHSFEARTLTSLEDAAEAIRSMRVRGAPLIGATAAYGLALGLANDPSEAGLRDAARHLIETRPTAVNLRWAIDRMVDGVLACAEGDRADRAWVEAAQICDEDVATNERIGEVGLEVLRELAASKPNEPLQILTHCNAGWLATVDWGTALAPIYKAQAAGLPVHVWVDETRPRNQGASLTAFELREQGIPHTVIVDNAGGHLMQRGDVDVVLVGSDRTTAHGDVCNKIGTYLKALAARDHEIPFYVALPVSTIDWTLGAGVGVVPIEERAASEVRVVRGRGPSGDLVEVELFDAVTPVANPAFDVTPSRLVTGLVTECGVYPAEPLALQGLKERVEKTTGRDR